MLLSPTSVTSPLETNDSAVIIPTVLTEASLASPIARVAVDAVPVTLPVKFPVKLVAVRTPVTIAPVEVVSNFLELL